MNLEHCMKYDCKNCKRFKECELNDVKKKNKDSNKRAKQKRKKHLSIRSALYKS